MGLYGSPDLSKKYANAEEKTKKKIRISIQTVVLVVLYIILMINNKNRFIMTVSYVGVISMVYFTINSVIMIIKLFKKEKVNREVIRLLMCIVIFTICGILI